MKKVEKLQRRLAQIEQKINAVAFTLQDSSYRRAGGYIGTSTPDLSNVIVICTSRRTKYLNDYKCVKSEHKDLADLYNQAQAELKFYYARQRDLVHKNWLKNAGKEAVIYAEQQIKDGTIFTPYAKWFFVGNRNIYLCSPLYGHADYNKSVIMPNTPRYRKLAEELNEKFNQYLSKK